MPSTSFFRKRVADDLAQYRQWSSHLHDLGECEVKHDVRLHLVNLFTAELGNPEVPQKLLRQAKGQTAPAVGRRGEELWIAVLPFKSSGDAEMESFADGLGEEITTGLSRFRYLSVVASTSAARLKGERETSGPWAPDSARVTCWKEASAREAPAFA